jgi:hypothetical protein
MACLEFLINYFGQAFIIFIVAYLVFLMFIIGLSHDLMFLMFIIGQTHLKNIREIEGKK